MFSMFDHNRSRMSSSNLLKGSNSLVIPLRNPLDHPIRLIVDRQTLPDVIVRLICKDL